MYDEYEDGGGRSPARIIATVVAVVAIAAAGWFLVKPRLGGDDGPSADQVAATTDTATAGPTETTVESSLADEEEDPAPTTTEAEPEPTTTTAAPTTTAPPTTQATTTTVAAVAPPAPPPPVGYDTLPDGSPAPVVAIFDVSQITLTGAVPDQAAVDRLSTLAIANSRFPAAVANFLTINPNVPRTVPVRVVELTSSRFPDGSAEILPPHALELDRVVTVMNALPNVSVLVVGHADQRGDDLNNFAISDARARAVVNYLVASGVAASRVSARAVGESDLLSLNNDAAALELNRRTEFIFTGLLVQ